MQIDKQLCNRILSVLAEDYPGTMSRSAFDKVCADQTNAQQIAGHFKYLEEKGLIETELHIDEYNDSRDYQINIFKTRILSSGIDFLDEGGYQ